MVVGQPITTPTSGSSFDFWLLTFDFDFDFDPDPDPDPELDKNTWWKFLWSIPKDELITFIPPVQVGQVLDTKQ